MVDILNFILLVFEVRLIHVRLKVYEYILVCMIISIRTVEPRLSEPHLTGCSDYPDSKVA